MRNVEERTNLRQEKLEEQEQEEDRSDRRSQPCVDATGPGLRLSRVANVRLRPQPHTLGYITRRDLYSRLTSLCEGRIRSVRIRHSCIRALGSNVCLFLCPSPTILLLHPRPSSPEPGSIVLLLRRPAPGLIDTSVIPATPRGPN